MLMSRPTSLLNRKSRLDGGKPSLLPKPRQSGSIDRLSTEARRPSAVRRSCSADAPRATFGGRLSKEASATKIPLNGKSRTQQGDYRYTQSSLTPLRSNQNPRTMTTPVRTPSEDRRTRCWQSSLERALAFVTVKDQRAVSSAAWQRGGLARAAAALGARGAGALVRPLTIARFVALANMLLEPLFGRVDLNNDNYVTKVPLVMKRLLYPGTISKSWLQTVNTLHAFPHALALLLYLLDLEDRIETPLQDQRLYADKNELSLLRHTYLNKCWIWFQDPEKKFDSLNEEYFQELKALLGNDEQIIVELQEEVAKYAECVEESADTAARVQEAALLERRAALASALRAERRARADARAERAQHAATAADLRAQLAQLDIDLQAASGSCSRLSAELAAQTMSVGERARLLEEVDYAARVLDSKQALAAQLAKTIQGKETTLAHWQKTTLYSCMEYNQGLIHLSTEEPEVAQLAIDENSLMASECISGAQARLEQLRAAAARRVRTSAHRRQQRKHHHQHQEQVQIKLSEVKAALKREKEELERELCGEAAGAADAAAAAGRGARAQDALRADALAAQRAQLQRAQCQEEHDQWERLVSELAAHVRAERGAARGALGRHARRAAAALGAALADVNRRLHSTAQP